MTCIPITYVFLDLETTGKDQTNRTKITEISLVAVKREHLLETRIGCSPRVQHKLTLCVNPRKLINPGGTGLSNDVLEFEPTFDKNLIILLNMFINLLTKPVCLIAFNGLKFDFPILRNHLEKFRVGFSEDVACADCFQAFYYIMEPHKTNKMEAPKFLNTNDIKTDSRNKKSPTPLISLSPMTSKNNQCRMLETGRLPCPESNKTKKMEASLFVNTSDVKMDSDDDMELLNINTCNMKSRNETSPILSISMSPVTPKKPKHTRMLESRRFLWPEYDKKNEMEASTFVNTNNMHIESDDDMELFNINTCDMKSRNERSPTSFISLSPMSSKNNQCRMLETGRLLCPESNKTKKMEASSFVNTSDVKMDSDDDMELLNINTCNMKSRNETSPILSISMSPVTPKKPKHTRMLESRRFLWPEYDKKNEMEASTFVNTNNMHIESDDDMELFNINTCDMKSRNERSPTSFISLSPVTPEKPYHIRKLKTENFPWPAGEIPKEKYKLKDIYKRLLNRPARNSHQAENDCLFALECAVALSEKFVKWVDENNYLFSQIRPMTIGVPLGR